MNNLPSRFAALPGSTRIGLLLMVLFVFAPPTILGLGQAFWLDVLTRMLILSTAAVTLNFILGYGGMISFGHAAFLGIGAYCVGIPAYYDSYNGVLHLVLAAVVAGLFGLITGLISLRTRGVHFIMITMAFGQMVYFTFVSLEEYGGDDGLIIYDRSDFQPLLRFSDDVTFYYVCLALLVIAIYIIHRLVASRFGMVVKGAKSNERRMGALGFPVYRYRLTAYVISASICGVAGALLGNFTEFISPTMMDWTRSGELIFMVVLGGTATLFGPVYGVVAFLVLEELIPGVMDFVYDGSGVYWHLPFGLMLLLVVLFGRGGIAGLLDRLWKKSGEAPK